MSCHYLLRDKLQRREGTRSHLHSAVVCFCLLHPEHLAWPHSQELVQHLEGKHPPAREHHHTGTQIYTLRAPFN